MMVRLMCPWLKGPKPGADGTSTVLSTCTSRITFLQSSSGVTHISIPSASLQSPPPFERSLSNAIAPCDRGLLPCNCTHKYSEHTTSREPFGPEGEYVTDEEAGRPLHPLPVYTEHLTYDVMSAQFSLFLALTETKDTVLSNLTEAKNADWIDEASRVVSLDMLFYNADSESFARASCFIEYFQTGRGIPGCFFYAPFVLELFGQDVWLTILNLVLFMYTLPMLYWLVQSVHFRLFRKKSYHIWGDLFQAAHLGMLIAICTLRAKMWNLASVMTSGYFYSEFVTPAFGGFGVGSAEGHLMFHYFSQYTWYMRTYDQVLALGVIMTWFRVFRYIQHFQQLNVLSETAKNAALDVLRLTVTFIWSVASFSIAGCVLFGANLREFETPTHAGSTLIRMLFVEHEPDYDGMRDIQPVWAPVFLAMYFILCYFMLLNMVLAVIVSSFTTVQAAQENARKQMQARQDGLLDEEIAQLRTQSTSVAVATASQSTRFLRLARFVKQTVNAAKASVAIIVDTNHAEREEAIHIAKAHCAKDLRIPREVLSERPEFYRRISISKGEMKRVFRSLLSDDDLERLFMGVQKEEMEDQDKTAILAAAFSEQTRDLKAHFEHVETRFDRLHDVIKMMAARREAADRDLASLRAQVDRLRRDDDQRSGSVHSAGNRAKREAADGGDHFRRHVRDLESERDFLITRLASSEQRSRDGDTAFLYQQPALSMSPYTPLQPN
ncbi:Polycystin-2 [Diplonema papillatum]|nr:Polycystin-2 [Diplonema papillatum]